MQLVTDGLHTKLIPARLSPHPTDHSLSYNKSKPCATTVQRLTSDTCNFGNYLTSRSGVEQTNPENQWSNSTTMKDNVVYFALSRFKHVLNFGIY